MLFKNFFDDLRADLLVNPRVQAVLANPFLIFVNKNRSFALAMLYIITTAMLMNGIYMVPFIIHLLSYALVFSMRWQAKRKNGTSTSILMLITIAAIGLTTDPSNLRIDVQIFTWLILAVMWWEAAKEADEEEAGAVEKGWFFRKKAE